MRIVDEVLDRKGKLIPFSNLAEDYFHYNPVGSKWRFDRIANDLMSFLPMNLTEIDFITFIYSNFKRIILASPHELQGLVNLVERRFPGLLYQHERQTNFGKRIEDIFSYKSFRKSNKAKWYARALNIKTCLYCNAQFTLQISKKGSSGILYQFDHYFSKSKYPFLSLSMFNLIPSCSNCNTAKSKSEFNLSNSIHPYWGDMNKSLVYNASNPDVLDFILNHKSGSKISVLLKHKNLKVQKHIDTFSLDKIANEHTDFVEEIFLRAYYYDTSKQKELITEFTGLIDSNTIKRFILGNYYLDNDLNKRPLAKMTKDIAKQIKLI